MTRRLAGLAAVVMLLALAPVALSQQDTTGPIISSARALSLTEVRVTVSEDLDAGSVAVEDFDLVMGNERRRITGVNVAGREVVLTSSGWRAGEAGNVRFTGAGAVRDRAGNGNAGESSVTVAAGPGDNQAPEVTRLSVSPSTFCAARGSRCRGTGTTVSFEASEPGDAVLRVEGARKGSRTYKVEDAGLTKVRFSGEIRGKPLPPGSHRFSVVMEDSVGNSNAGSAPSVEVTVKDPGKPLPKRRPAAARPKSGAKQPARGGEPSTAPKNAPLTTVGIADQSPTMFAAPLFRSLGVKRSRYGPAWNSIFTEPEVVDTWMKAAQAAGVEPLIAFNTARGSNCPTQPCKLPSVTEYRTAFRAFREKYPWVKNYQPWNEANHQSQPTARNPKAAAQYYNVVKAECRSCTVVALDLLDSSNMTRYLKSFLLYANGKPRLWGLHNYSDVNRFTAKGTKTLLRTVKGDVWITESGGLVAFETKSGRKTFPSNEKRAAKATEFMFKISRDYRHRIKRLYIYHWQGGTDNRFDAGIVRSNGSARPTYQVIRRHKAQIK
jgi:hypothetical protein